MEFPMWVQGVGITLLLIIGLAGMAVQIVILHRKGKHLSVFENILALNIVFNLIVLLSGFSLISVSVYYEHYQYHSNSHFSLLPYLMFTTCVGATGSSWCIILLCMERYLLASYPCYHGRLNMKIIILIVTLFSLLNSVYVIFEFETICHGRESAHENFLGVCPEGQKAYLVFSDLRSHLGYRLFCTLSILIFNQLLPFLLTVFFTLKNYRPGLFVNPELVLTMRSILASTLLLITNLFQLLPLSYEFHTLTMDAQSFHFNMPDWMMKCYQVSHFLALLPPAVYPFIFHSTDFLLLCENMTLDREVLLENEAEDAEESQMTSVCLEK